MWLELSEAETGDPVLVNTDQVGHWVPYGDGTLCEQAYRWNADEARTIAVRQPYEMIKQTLFRYRKEPPNMVVTLISAPLSQPRRQRKPRATPQA